MGFIPPSHFSLLPPTIEGKQIKQTQMFDLLHLSRPWISFVNKNQWMMWPKVPRFSRMYTVTLRLPREKI